MLRRNREIVIFNLSAIDLFCSGMGAVMVLMVLLMPYYGKKSPLPPAPPVVAVTPPVPPQPEPELKSGVRLKSIEVVLVMDATASMTEELAAVRNGMVSIVQVLRRLGDEVSVGFVAYTDRDVPWAIPLLPVGRNLQGDANLQRLLRGMAEVRLLGNQDWPEDVCAGLEKAVSAGWSPPTADRMQLMVLIGDARTHPEDRDRSLGLVRTWVGSGRQTRGVHTVFTPPLDLAQQPGYEEEIGASLVYFKDVAQAGNGQDHADPGDLLGSLLDILIVR